MAGAFRLSDTLRQRNQATASIIHPHRKLQKVRSRECGFKTENVLGEKNNNI